MAQGTYWYLYYQDEQVNGGLSDNLERAESTASWAANRHSFDKSRKRGADSESTDIKSVETGRNI